MLLRGPPVVPAAEGCLLAGTPRTAAAAASTSARLPSPYHPPRSRKCGNNHGLIRKYSMNLCRRCFREAANMIGFVKVSMDYRCRLVQHGCGSAAQRGALQCMHSR